MAHEKGTGKTPGSGRKAGTPNKLTSVVKDAIEQAFSDMGGAEYLKKVAIMDMKAFCSLLGKVLPKDIEIMGEGGGPLKIIIVTGVPKEGEDKPDADSSH